MDSPQKPLLSTPPKPVLQARRLNIMPSKGVKRTLFEPVDHSELEASLREKMDAIHKESQERWNFDFEAEKPLTGKYDWEKVGTEEYVPACYQRVYTNGVNRRARCSKVSPTKSPLTGSPSKSPLRGSPSYRMLHGPPNRTSAASPVLMGSPVRAPIPVQNPALSPRKNPIRASRKYSKGKFRPIRAKKNGANNLSILESKASALLTSSDFESGSESDLDLDVRVLKNSDGDNECNKSFRESSDGSNPVEASSSSAPPTCRQLLFNNQEEPKERGIKRKQTIPGGCFFIFFH